ncbi:MAG: hypothetical protein ABID38_02945 [Candidatus Diapherotrites archaeon]
MIRKLALALALLLAISYASAAGIDITSPSGLPSYVLSGKTVDVQATSQYNITKVLSVYINCPLVKEGKFIAQDYVVEPPSKSVKFPLDTTGLYGNCQLSISVYVQGGEILSYSDTQKIQIDHPLLKTYYENGANICRLLPDMVWPGSVVKVPLMIESNEKFTGLIITETLPEGVEKFAGGWGPHITNNYDEDTRTLKMLLMDPEELEKQDIDWMFKVNADAPPGTKISFSGSGEVLGSSREIKCDSETTIGGFVIPGCPITDQQLLGYVNQWGKGELAQYESKNDEAILQIVKAWKDCP